MVRAKVGLQDQDLEEGASIVVQGAKLLPATPPSHMRAPVLVPVALLMVRKNNNNNN